MIYLAVLNKNPIFSVLYLIFAFLAVSAFLLYLSADYLAILIILIYGGAISILIMFVVMMLDLQKLELEYGPNLVYFLTIINFSFMFFSLVYLSTIEPGYTLYEFLRYINWYEVFNYKSNIEVIGISLYNYHTSEFLLLGFLLFFSMIVIISLVLRKRFSTKVQNVYDQLNIKNLILYKTSN